MSVLVDTPVWVNYFRSGKDSGKLDFLIDENLIVINDLILAELVPFLEIRDQRKLLRLLRYINKLPLNIDWDQLIELQIKCLKKGVNGIGILDLMIAQNAKQNLCEIYSLDYHFQLIKDIVGFELLD
jgi:predicted nucleic acid-binding protein